ncbi:hypothetical protein HG531_006653 [Fusarium graminearum]|nr:hypothetical protein HG531_006653 [Fusarium graminearum]
MLENSGFENLNGDDEVEKNVVIPEDHPIISGWEPLSNKYRLPPVVANLTLSAREKRKMLESSQTGYFDFETFCKSVVCDAGVEDLEWQFMAFQSQDLGAANRMQEGSQGERAVFVTFLVMNESDAEKLKVGKCLELFFVLIYIVSIQKCG